MHTRTASGAEIAAAAANAATGGPPFAVTADEGAPPTHWQLEGPPLEPDVAVLVGTSGSTGGPKGVLLSRGAITASVHATHRRLGGCGHWVCPLPLHYVAGLMTAARAAMSSRARRA